MKRTCGCHSHNGLLLSPEGLAQREGSCHGVDSMGLFQYLDTVGSVSALAEAEDLLVFDDVLIDEQYRRAVHGS